MDCTTINANTTGILSQGIGTVLNWAYCVLSGWVISVLIALATVAFIYGVIEFFLNPNSEEKRKKGKAFIVGGLIALFMIIAVWQVVGVFTQTFLGTQPALPKVPQ